MQDVELTSEILDTIEEIIFSGEFLMAIEMLRNLRTTAAMENWFNKNGNKVSIKM